MPPALATWAAGAFLGMAVAAFAFVHLSTRHLREPAVRRNADRLAVNSALCFAWPACVLLLLPEEELLRGYAVRLTALVVLWCLCFDVRAVVRYVGPLDDYEPGESLGERSRQISTAAFAAGTFLLSSRSGQVAPCVTALVFVSLLLCVLSAVPSGGARQGLAESATWETAQRACVSAAAGFLALAIAVCVDHKLS